MTGLDVGTNSGVKKGFGGPTVFGEGVVEAAVGIGGDEVEEKRFGVGVFVETEEGI